MTYPFVGPVEVPAPTAGTNPTTKTYVDNGLATKAAVGHTHTDAPAAHAASHASAGSDPVSPVSIGAATSGHTHSPAIKPFPPVTLADAATIATDASLGTHFRVTLTTSRALGAPTNPTDGQVAVWEVLASGATLTLTLNTVAGGFKFGTDIAGPLTATTTGTRDLIQAAYNAAADRWFVIGYVKGY